MVDLLDISSGQITIRDPSGAIKFNSNEPMFHITDVANSNISISWPFYTSNQTFSRNQDYFIQSVNPLATHVFGGMRTGSDSGGRLLTGTWYDASGTYVHRWSWIYGTRLVRDNEAFNVRHYVHYTFRASGGSLVLNENVLVQPYDTGGLQSTLLGNLSPFSIQFRLKIGLFV